MGCKDKSLWKEAMINITSKWYFDPTSYKVDRYWAHSTDSTTIIGNNDILFQRVKWLDKIHL